MARPPKISRIRKEDVTPEFQPIVDAIGGSLNNFMDETINAFNKNINFENLNQEIKTLDITIGSTGELVNIPSIKHAIRGKLEGILCIYAYNLTDSSLYPTSAPFVSFTINADNTIRLLNISGLQNNNQYKVKLLLIGS